MLTALFVLIAASVVVMLACNAFDEASDYLGRNMAPGIKGATINAIGSSLPELLTTMILLFLFSDVDGFSGGIATCAGSAVFNAIIIPALCILAVTTWGVKGADGVRHPVTEITVGKTTILRDGIFFILAQVLLIVFLGDTRLAWWMGGGLMLLYVAYVGWVLRSMKGTPAEDDDDAEEEEEEEEEPRTTSRVWAAITLDLRTLFYGQAPLTDRNAWVVLGGAVGIISLACYGLSWSVVEIADIMGVPLYFTTVILAAAATSVPDTVLSVKDALAGNYDDAIANAVGSNIFDICVALGLPLFLYGIVFGEVTLEGDASGSSVQGLRIALLLLSFVVIPLFMWGGKLDRRRAYLLFGLYGLWMAYIGIDGLRVAGVFG